MKAENFTTLFSSRRTSFLPIVSVRPSSFNAFYEVKVAAVLDSASSDWFITEDLVRRLGLQQFPIEAEVGTVGDGSTKATTAVNLRVDGLSNEVRALVLPRICGNLATMPVSAFDEATGTLDLSQDPVARKIDLLIGVAQTFDAIRTARPIEGAPGMFYVDTVFGPCLTGETDLQEEEKGHSLLSNAALHDYLGRFFRIESLGITSCPNDENLTEEVLAQKMFDEGLVFNEQRKRYQAPLLFKPNARPLKNNVNAARACLFSLEKKLKKTGLRKTYNDAMAVYMERGDAELVPASQLHDEECFYLPHNVVLRLERSTTKHRLVWNASKADKSGVSLNSEILKTPVLVPKLTGILMRFRVPLYAVAGDVEKMFLNVDLPDDAKKYHRFVWRESEAEPIKHYQLTTMTMGVSDSPFKAIAITRHHAQQHADRFPAARKVLCEDMYVDDGLTGGDTVAECVDIIDESNEVLAKASFRMRKYVSNSPEVMEQIPEELRGVPGHKLLKKNLGLADGETEDGEVPNATALGVEWDVSTDRLIYSGFSSLRDDLERPTKRSMASVAARFFDPLGLICPFTVTGQVLLQKAWLESREWDTPVSDALAKEWKNG